MWAQLIKRRLKPGHEAELELLRQHLQATERPGSGLVRSTTMRDQNDPHGVYTLVVFESEEKARALEQDPPREEVLRGVRAAMAEMFEGPPEFTDLTVVTEYTDEAHARGTQEKEKQTMTTETEVKQASDQFYTALNQMLATGDAGALPAVWSQGQAGSTMNPIGGRGLGRDQVLALWEQAGPAFSEGNASVDDLVVIPLGDDVAYTVGTERFAGKVGGETFRGGWRATNIYRRENGGWKMVHHHTDASPELIELLARLQATAGQTTG